MKILVTDGDNRAALAITRSLGRRHEVVVCAPAPRSLSAVSRWCSESFVYPDPAVDERGFIETLEREVRERNIDVLLPVADITTILLSENRHRFEPACRIPVPRAETIKLAADKVAIIELAQKLGVPVPTGITALNRAEALEKGSKLNFPVVMKPARSRVRVDDRWLSSTVQHAADRAELERVLTNLPDPLYPVVIQERIYGPGVGLFLCYDKDRPVAAFCHRRLREKPPSGGISVLRESAPLDAQARASAERLLEHLGWQGVAMVEFKRDQRDGVAKLMEINGRFWGSLQLAIDAGMDFPSLLVDAVNGAAPEQDPGYHVGVRSRWFWGDVDGLLAILLKAGERAKLPPEKRGRLRALLEFLRPHKNCHWEVFRFNDVEPWMVETWRWFFRR
jgi:predicted ATP-grasp superfamily ATP-dependent carboligase